MFVVGEMCVLHTLLQLISSVRSLLLFTNIPAHALLEKLLNVLLLTFRWRRLCFTLRASKTARPPSSPIRLRRRFSRSRELFCRRPFARARAPSECISLSCSSRLTRTDLESSNFDRARAPRSAIYESKNKLIRNQ